MDFVFTYKRIVTFFFFFGMGIAKFSTWLMWFLCAFYFVSRKWELEMRVLLL